MQAIQQLRRMLAKHGHPGTPIPWHSIAKEKHGSSFWFCLTAVCSGKELMVSFQTGTISLFQRDLSMWLALVPQFGQPCHTEFILGVTQSLWPQWHKFYEPYFYRCSCCGVIFAISEISTVANIRVVFLLPDKLARIMPLVIVLSVFVPP